MNSRNLGNFMFIPMSFFSLDGAVAFWRETNLIKLFNTEYLSRKFVFKMRKC